MRLIKLTGLDDRPVYINPEYITDITTVDHPLCRITRVGLRNDVNYYVVEDAETIAKMLTENDGDREVIS